MKINILDIQIDNIPKSAVLEKIREWLNSSGQHKIFTPNPEMLVLASQDKNFKEILNNADLLIPDGFGLILASWFLKTPFAERITGVELVYDITKVAADEKKSIFLLGGAGGVGSQAVKRLQSEINNLSPLKQDSTIAEKSEINWLDGININQDHADKNMIRRINDARPDILLVALGHGKQEKFIYNFLSQLPSIKIAMGIGGALDFIAGRAHRAPRLLQRFGFEWLWRLLLQPWRLWRIFNAVIIFPIKLLCWQRKRLCK